MTIVKKIKAQGMSLIELMIAMLLGIVLVFGLVQVFTASKAAYITAEGLSRVQESSRFTMDFLQHDLRMVGFTGCVSDQVRTYSQAATSRVYYHMASPLTNATTAPFPFRFDMPIQGFEATSTGPGATLDRSATSTPPLATGGTQWQPALPTWLWNQINNRAIQGSDILVVRYLSGDALPAGRSTTNIQIDTTYTRPANFIQTRQIYGISDCLRLSYFQSTSGLNTATGIFQAANGVEQNVSPWIGLEQYSTSAWVSQAQFFAYFVGLADRNGDGTGDEPALYRLGYQITGGGGEAGVNGVVEEVVDGVENLQVLYRYDQNGFSGAEPMPDGQAETEATAAAWNGVANAVAQWRYVGAVRVGLLIRSPEAAATPQRDELGLGANFLVAGMTYVPPDDVRMRKTYENVITLRNRLGGN